MEFRPCIDIHNGSVKQIVGSSLSDLGDYARENFVSGQDAAFYAKLYSQYGIKGGHVILLNKEGSPYYEETKKQALMALAAYPGGLQVGGGITDENAKLYLDSGASHVIVTSFVFCNGKIDYDRLQRLVHVTGKEHLVLDLSCKKTENGYYIMTDRWQKQTDTQLSSETMEQLSAYCDEFLIHAVDVEGKNSGIEEELVSMLSAYEDRPITYAGGVHDFADLSRLKKLGKDHINVTIGSALDLFGGQMAFTEVLKACGA